MMADSKPLKNNMMYEFLCKWVAPLSPPYLIKGYIRQAYFGLIIERFAPKQPKSCVPEFTRILISTYVLV